MPKPATGKWPRIQFTIICHTCKTQSKFSIYYGESTIWANQNAHKLAEWAQHEGYDVEVQYDFYDGHERGAAQ